MTTVHDIAVFCDHGGERHGVGRLVMARLTSAPALGWTLQLVADAGGDFVGAATELSGDRALPRFVAVGTAGELEKAGRYRLRYRFVCECGDTLPAREHKLEKAGAELAGHGAPEVSMSALRRMLALL